MSERVNEASKSEATFNWLCLALEIALQVSLPGYLVSSETSVKHNSPIYWVTKKKKKKKKKLIKSEKIFWSKTFGPLPSYSQGGEGYPAGEAVIRCCQ